MDRKALLLYLQNIRDLEVAKYKLDQNYLQAKKQYENTLRTLKLSPKFKNQPEKPTGIGACVSCAIFFFLLGILLLALPSRKQTGGGGQLGIILIFVGIAFLIGAYNYGRKISSWREYSKTVNAANAREREQVKKDTLIAQSLTLEWEKNRKTFDLERDKVNSLLNDFYSMNFISNEYRHKLAAIQYIYEVTFTTQLSYEQILFHTKIEDGIRRIEEKLDQVLVDLEDIVYETRCIRKENQEFIKTTIQQNEHMLDHLQQIELNSQATAQYAKLSANYAKANAYFELAHYLKK